MNAIGLIDFAKTIANIDRLRIIGLLVKKPQRLSEISDVLGFHPSETAHHLAQLIHSGLIHVAGATYELDKDALEKLAREQFNGERRAFTPKPDLENNQRQVLSAYLDPEGTLKTIPLQPGKRQIILEYLLNAFNIGVNYREKEVNLILAHFHPDTAALRRYLIDAGMLERERDGSRYWRPK
jgi:hypothetical protein